MLLVWCDLFYQNFQFPVQSVSDVNAQMTPSLLINLTFDSPIKQRRVFRSARNILNAKMPVWRLIKASLYNINQSAFIPLKESFNGKWVRVRVRIRVLVYGQKPLESWLKAKLELWNEKCKCFMFRFRWSQSFQGFGFGLAWLGLAFGYDMASRSSSSYKFWPKAPLRSALVPPMVPSRSGSQLWIGFGLRGAFRAIVNFSVRRPVSVDGHKKPSKT